MYFKTFSMLLILAIGTASCAAMNRSNPERIDDWLKADYNQMKKRLILLERENSVLTDEHEQDKKDLTAQTEKVDNLTREVESLRKKYDDDVRQWDSHVKYLNEQHAALEKGSAQKIQDLTQLTKDTELKYANEVRLLNAEIAKQRDTCTQEREAIQNQAAHKESALTQQVEALNKEIADRDTMIASLKTSQREQSKRLEDTMKELDARNRSAQLLEEQVNDLKRRLKVLERPAPQESQGANR